MLETLTAMKSIKINLVFMYDPLLILPIYSLGKEKDTSTQNQIEK